MASRTAVLTLNTCLLPVHLRWTCRPHRIWESTARAAVRIADAITAHHTCRPCSVVHLQEVFTREAFFHIADRLRAAGFTHNTGFQRSGLCTFATSPIVPVLLRETPSLTESRPKAWQAMRIGHLLYVNLHFSSIIDGGHFGRMVQASALGDWLREELQTLEPGDLVLVIGDTNEPDGPAHDELAGALGASALGGLQITHSMLRGAIGARLDRAYRYVPGEAAGGELAGEVLQDLPDISDHWAVRFEIAPAKIGYGASPTSSAHAKAMRSQRLSSAPAAPPTRKRRTRRRTRSTSPQPRTATET
jgi:hypothetical protein